MWVVNYSGNHLQLHLCTSNEASGLCLYKDKQLKNVSNVIRIVPLIIFFKQISLNFTDIISLLYNMSKTSVHQCEYSHDLQQVHLM